MEEKSGVATLTLTQRFSTTVFWRLPLQSLANALETETTLAPMNSLCYLTTLLR